jgi:hypothetical protein
MSVRFWRNEDGRGNAHQNHQCEPQYSGHHCNLLVVSRRLRDIRRDPPRLIARGHGIKHDEWAFITEGHPRRRL